MNRLLFFLLAVSFQVFCQSPWLNVRVSSLTANSPEEVSIAINPLDPQNLIAGSNLNYVYRSTNGGATWTQATLTSQYGVWGDPVLIFDASGNAYYAHLSNPPSSGYWIDRIVVQKSTDKGITWSPGVGVGYNPPVRNQDKEWLAVDFSNGPRRNYLYMCWTEFDDYGSSSPADSSRILFSRSSDAGQTWSVPQRINERAGDCIDEDNTVEGAVPAVGPNGELYVAWAGPSGLLFDRSTDGGITWGNDIFVSALPGGWDFSIPGIYRANGLPITACDISLSPYRGNIYINWTDQRNGITNTDVFLARSTDGGTTWSAPLKVNGDTVQRQQFFTWMTVDPITGYIYVVYYDRRNYSNNSTDVYLARSTDGGNSFSEKRISQSPFTPIMSVFFGDYITLAAFNGIIQPIWTRMEGSALSIWTTTINDSALVVPVELTSFYGSSSGNSAMLYWKTATETNNAGFGIQRKIHSDWQDIGFVPGAGTTGEPQSYSFNDLFLPADANAVSYRLQQTDYNGVVSYSAEIIVTTENMPLELQVSDVFPNPFNSSAELTVSLPGGISGNLTVALYDILGRKIKTLLQNANAFGEYKIRLDAGEYSSGMYLCRIQWNNQQQTKKLLLLR